MYTYLFLVFTLRGETEAMVNVKFDELRKRIKWVSCTSALLGAFPVPAVSILVDMKLLSSEIEFQREQLQIDEAAMKRNGGGTEEGRKVFEKRLNKRLKFIRFDNCISEITSMLVKTAGLAKVVEQASLWIPIVGSVTGAGISAASTYFALAKMLDLNRDIALMSLKVIIEMDLERESSKMG